MTRFEEFLKKNRVTGRREKRLVKEAWIKGLEEAKTLVKISARADMIEAGLDPNGDYEGTYAQGLEGDIQTHIDLHESRK